VPETNEGVAGFGEVGKALKLLVLVAVKDMTLKEQVSLMSKAGFGRSEMARLLGTTPNSISVRLAELKGRPKKAKVGSIPRRAKRAPARKPKPTN
jgi:hypothetical protein